MVYDSLTQSPFLDFVHCLFFNTFPKPTLRPSASQEAPKLVEPLDRAILSHWAPQVLLCLKTEAEPASETSCFLKKIRQWTKPPKKENVSVR